jgi:uncharacterized damage-inducible protein DinB
MKIIEAFAAELTHEAANTKKLLERLPEEQFGWQPHPKSMSLGKLASHITEILEWVGPTLNMDELVMQPGQSKPYMAASKSELLARYDDNLAKALGMMKDAPDELMMKAWRFKIGERVVMEMPKAVVLRTMILSHTFHHRGQMTVYLRLNDVPLPQIYGPTADEPAF